MNVPGTAAGNWSWRVDEAELTPAVAEQMSKLTALYGRAPAGPSVAPFRSAL
jgi:4-alpha-glucanotransferase